MKIYKYDTRYALFDRFFFNYDTGERELKIRNGDIILVIYPEDYSGDNFIYAYSINKSIFFKTHPTHLNKECFKEIK